MRLALSAAFLIVYSSVFAADTILPLSNPDFEEGLTGWNVQTKEPANVQATPDAASIGEKGLLVQATDPQISSAPLPVKPGESYTVSFWAAGSTTPPGKILVEIVFKNAAGETLQPEMCKIRKWPTVERGGGRFFGKTILGAKAPTAAETLTIAIRSAKSSPGGAIYLDDFIVRELGESIEQPRGPDGSAPIPPFNPERIAFLEKEIARDPNRGKSPPKIVFKFDDLAPKNGTVHERWVKVAEWAKNKGIIVTMGIIAAGMEKDCPGFTQWVKDRHAEGRIEFWNHGWDHAQWKNAEGKDVREFSGSGYEHQKKHLENAQQVAKEKLGFAFASFGAGFNDTDDDTVRVLAEDPDTKVWIYGTAKKLPGKTALERCYDVTIESPTFIPNYADFLEGYAHNRGAEYFVLQGHPMQWNQERWDQCNKIVDFLLAQKAVFVKFTDLAP